ncbi:uncharacterized protein LAESUDRAFT_225765 [Laetiporus sulphureus 93-53]|uniref:Secreted protein n=1 Tax=Laetiporus sulphureus 93-53 TaxID=1314785 RepID=A0A165DPN4_9APHY|nr:uncharacterized protein LAESUDRAFT_225765 [Laetiporus sulphureus 93-53]KZT05349.1 hypothetical protein LAESUDRAFT_225765 [Laetiporus sulphureus 93-53]
MVASFIPFRAFAISALLVGAFSPACRTAPVPTALKTRGVEERNCRILGCLFAESHPIKLLSERENESLNAVNTAVPLAIIPEDLELAAKSSRSVDTDSPHD